MSEEKFERELAKCKGMDIQDNDHGGLMLGGVFEYESGNAQGLGWGIDMEFLKRFMDVFGVMRLRDVNGKSCWVLCNSSKIVRIEPLHKKDGEAFDILEWAKKRESLATKR